MTANPEIDKSKLGLEKGPFLLGGKAKMEDFRYFAEAAKDNAAALIAGASALVIGGGLAIRWAYNRFVNKNAIDLKKETAKWAKDGLTPPETGQY